MAKIIFMISIVLLSSYLTEQTKLSYDTVDTEINNLRVSKYVIFKNICIYIQYTITCD